MTNPQNDVPCRDCKRPTQHATERCDDCRTPAGRLVTALAARGLSPITNTKGIVWVKGHTIVCEPGDECEPWVISDVSETLDDATESAANAIAAIVQAPGLRTERDAVQTGIGALWDMLDRAGVRDDVDDRYMQQVSEHCYEPAGEHRRADVLERVGFLVADRDAIAAENARLRAELEKPVARAWSQSEVTDRAFRDAGDLAAAVRMEVVEDGPPWGWCIWSQRAHERIASGPETGDAGRHAADLALIAAGYRLIGGVHPLPSEVSDGH